MARDHPHMQNVIRQNHCTEDGRATLWLPQTGAPAILIGLILSLREHQFVARCAPADIQSCLKYIHADGCGLMVSCCLPFNPKLHLIGQSLKHLPRVHDHRHFPCILWFQLYNGQFVALLFDPHSECHF